MSLRLKLLNAALRRFVKPQLARATQAEPERRRFERAARLFRATPGVLLRERPLAGRAAMFADPPGAATDACILYLHGGAYAVGSHRTHARLGAALAARTGLTAVLPDYRLAPEHAFPAAPDDARAAWDALRAEGRKRIVLMGESAGGGLAFALLQDLLAAGDPPAAVVAFSPWTDLTLGSESLARNRESDPLLPREPFELCVGLYLAGADPRDPRASPVFGRYEGAPPVLIQLSLSEMLEDDGHRLAAALTRDGVDVLVQSWDDTPHAWQMGHGFLPEAEAALDAAARFVREKAAA